MNGSIDALIRRTQRQARHRRPDRSLAAVIEATFEEIHTQTARRRLDGDLYYQLTNEDAENPAVGLYIRADRTRFLQLTPNGIPTVQDVDAFVANRGEKSLRSRLRRARKAPPKPAGAQGADVLDTYRRFASPRAT